MRAVYNRAPMDALERAAALGTMGGFARAIGWGKGGYQPTWYGDVICEHADLVMRTLRGEPGGLDALAISMPPRHGKTFHCSELLPAYAFARDPSTEIISLTYSLDLARDSRINVGEIMGSDAYREISQTRIGAETSEEMDDDGRVSAKRVAEKATANELRTLYEDPQTGQVRKARGLYLASSLGGKCTGKGMNLGILDDLHKNQQEAESATERKRVEREIDSTFLTRSYGRCGFVVLMTRWHQYDAFWYLTQKWEELARQTSFRYAVLNFPAEKEGEPTPTDPREPGEFLAPARFGEEFYRRKKITTPEATWRSLYQGDPTPIGGRPFPRSVWGWYDPADLQRGGFSNGMIVLSIDCNNKEGGTSFAQIDVWALLTIPGPHPAFPARKEAWKLDEARDKWGYDALLGEAVRLWRKWGSRVDYVLVEDKALGPTLAGALRRIQGEEHALRAQIETVSPGSLSKAARASTTEPLFRAGCVRLPLEGLGLVSNEWVEDHVREWADFPQAKNNDRVDTGVQFLRWAEAHHGLSPPADLFGLNLSAR